MPGACGLCPGSSGCVFTLDGCGLTEEEQHLRQRSNSRTQSPVLGTAFTCRDAHHTNISLTIFEAPRPPPPCQPHPSPSVLKGLLAAHEAELGVRKAGPDPLVSPRLKGSDYMENETHILYTCT